MNTTTALKGTAEHGGPMVLGAGVAMLAVALLAGGHDRYPVAAGPHPTPAATTTVTATRQPVTSHPSASPRASASGTSPPSTGTAPGTVTVAEHRGSPVGRAPRADGPPAGPSPAPSSPSRPAPSGPSPTARPPATSQQCGSQVLAVRLLKACVSLGGSQ